MLALVFATMISLNIMDDECVRIHTTVSGDSLQGQLWAGQEIEVLGLGCGVPKRYDYIVFRVEGDDRPIIKQLWGMPGDVVEVAENGRFTINGVQAKTPFSRPYVLLGSSRTRIGKLEKPLTGYLVLGHPGSIDSSKIGLIAEANILGFVPAPATKKPS